MGLFFSDIFRLGILQAIYYRYWKEFCVKIRVSCFRGRGGEGLILEGLGQYSCVCTKWMDNDYNTKNKSNNHNNNNYNNLNNKKNTTLGLNKRQRFTIILWIFVVSFQIWGFRGLQIIYKNTTRIWVDKNSWLNTSITKLMTEWNLTPVTKLVLVWNSASIILAFGERGALLLRWNWDKAFCMQLMEILH